MNDKKKQLDYGLGSWLKQNSGSIGSLLGTGAGMLIGGPIGAGIGSQIGGQVGGMVGAEDEGVDLEAMRKNNLANARLAGGQNETTYAPVLANGGNMIPSYGNDTGVFMDKTNPTNGLDNITQYKSGGSHEESSTGGIPLGDKGKVEEGEVRWGDYIFSDRIGDGIKIPGELKDGGYLGSTPSRAEIPYGLTPEESNALEFLNNQKWHQSSDTTNNTLAAFQKKGLSKFESGSPEYLEQQLTHQKGRRKMYESIGSDNALMDVDQFSGNLKNIINSKKKDEVRSFKDGGDINQTQQLDEVTVHQNKMGEYNKKMGDYKAYQDSLSLHNEGKAQYDNRVNDWKTYYDDQYNYLMESGNLTDEDKSKLTKFDPREYPTYEERGKEGDYAIPTVKDIGADTNQGYYLNNNDNYISDNQPLLINSQLATAIRNGYKPDSVFNVQEGEGIGYFKKPVDLKVKPNEPRAMVGSKLTSKESDLKNDYRYTGEGLKPMIPPERYEEPDGKAKAKRVKKYRYSNPKVKNTNRKKNSAARWLNGNNLITSK